MRSAAYGMIEDLASTFGAGETLEMFRKICFIRQFELNVKRAFDARMIKSPIYLSVGQESVAAALSVSFKEPYIFGQHRCHDLYLAYGGDPVALRDELLHRPTGCAGGMGGSASIHSPKIKMIGHDGLMGTQVTLAVGKAFAKRARTLTIMGDASAEEGYVLGALAWASTRNVPVLAVCLDNGLSILTKVEVRRSWDMASVMNSFEMPAVEITDDPWLVMYWARKLQKNLPAFMNIHTVRHLWHAGTGKDSEPEWDRLNLIKSELKNLGLETYAQKIEKEMKEEADAIWAPEFRKE